LPEPSRPLKKSVLRYGRLFFRGQKDNYPVQYKVVRGTESGIPVKKETENSSNHEEMISSASERVSSSDRDLRSVPHFRAIPAQILSEMERRCRWLHLHDGDLLVSAGEYLDRVFFLLQGELSLSFYTRSGKIVSFPSARKGAFIGITALGGGLQAPYSITAVGSCSIASLSARTFIEMIERDRDALNAVLRILVESQQMFIQRIVELSTLNVRSRIRNELMRLCRDKMASDGSAIITPIPTQAELASRIRTQREAVSREMRHLQNMGIVLRQDGALFVPDVSRLIDLTTQFED
jgi:CRP/FNR family cyclic AMP-dependent transcriptional regulator